eukprot:TRINITY_DN27692_c0_g1_i2.p1 TRINITY_DN27692_c0_g1~~TRINITY_DN27692_c0_g1_i2.p1  ORF type:complete len:424 (-),score=73.17 TRINITY_DN27692_c0_g1_i2:273-1544(-)
MGKAIRIPPNCASVEKCILEEAAREVVDSGKVPGVAVAIVKHGKVQHTVVTGLRNVEKKLPVQLDSVFQIASVSKTVTGVCAMQLVQKGDLSLDSHVNAVLSRSGAGFEVTHPRHPDQPITLRDLLSHCASIRDSEVYNDMYTAGDSEWTLGAFLKEYFSPDGCFYDAAENFLTDDHKEEVDDFRGSAPGSTYSYSNIGAGLVGYLVEVCSGKPFDIYAEENIFKPLGMTGTSFTWAGLERLGVSRDRAALPYSWHGKPGKGYYKPHGRYGCPTISDGFLRTTVLDLANFLLAVAHGGTHPTSKVCILQEALALEMKTPQRPEATTEYGLFTSLEKSEADEQSSASNIGLGDGRRLNTGRKLVGHGGADPGVGTSMFIDENTMSGVIILKNGDLGRDSDDVKKAHEEADKALHDAAWAFADTV